MSYEAGEGRFCRSGWGGDAPQGVWKVEKYSEFLRFCFHNDEMCINHHLVRGKIIWTVQVGVHERVWRLPHFFSS
jgi:hypothetical protein